MTTFMMDAIYRTNRIQIVNTKHEQAAGFAAEGQGRISGTPGVAFATSGPGATNLITAIGSAFFDSTPVVLITGQVNSAEIRSNRKQRQNGFQELDICSMVSGITKDAVQINSVEEFPKIFEALWKLSTSGRPGPVLVDIPIDLQQHFLPKYTSVLTLDESSSVQDFVLPIEAIREKISKSDMPHKPTVIRSSDQKIGIPSFAIQMSGTSINDIPGVQRCTIQNWVVRSI